MKKQILTIIYSVIAIVIGHLFSTTYDSFSFLVFIPIATMFTSYVVCCRNNRVDWLSIGCYFASLLIVFPVLFNLDPNGNVDELRINCMNSMTILFTILGTLSGGLLRYKIESGASGKKGEKEEEGNGRKEE